MDVIGNRFEIGLNSKGMDEVQDWINLQLNEGNAANVIGTFTYNIQNGVYIIILMSKILTNLSGFSTGTAVLTNQFDVRDTLNPLIEWLNTSATGLSAPFFPVLSQTAGGSLTGQGTVSVITTLVNPSGETLGSTSATLVVSDDFELNVASPKDSTGTAIGWNVYIGPVGSEKLQNQNPIPLGTSWVQSVTPNTGSAAPPNVNTTGYQSIQYIGLIERMNHKLINVILSNGQFGTKTS